MQVRVYNKNEHTYRELFKGKAIEIPAGGYIVMDQAEAIMFKGTIGQHPKKLGTGDWDKTTFKMIDIQPHTVQPVTPVIPPAKFICHYDGKEFGTQKELDAYIDENHLDKIKDPEVAEKRRRGRPSKSEA